MDPIKNPTKQYLKLDSWYGGLSDGDRVGIPGSFTYSTGVDYRINPDAITMNHALVKDSGSTVTGLVKWGTYDGIRGNHYFYDASGNLYKRTNTGTWSNIRAVTSSKGQGLEIFNNYLWYTQNSQLGKYGPLDSSPTFTDGAQTGLNGTTSWRPLKEFLNYLVVGNGQYLATLDSTGTWNDQRLTFPVGWFVHDLTVMGDYLAIAVNDEEDITQASRGILFLWDGGSSTYNTFSELHEGGGISAIHGQQDSVTIFGGIMGNIYTYTGRTNKVKRIPNVGNGATAYVNPGSVDHYQGYDMFGISGGNSSTIPRALYAWGQPNINYPEALNIESPISTGDLTNSGVAIGCVMSWVTNIFVGWQSGANFGVDILSDTTYQTSVTYRSRTSSYDFECAFSRFKVYLTKPLGVGESITVKVYKDHSATATTIGVLDYSIDGAITNKMLPYDLRTTDIIIELVLNGNGGSAPSVYKVVGEDEPIGTL